MAQSAIQVSETPPLSGLALVQQTNGAFRTVATDFAGSSDPAGLAGPYMTWADTSTDRLRRRNSANTAWVDIGGLFAVASSNANQGLIRISNPAETLALSSDLLALTPFGLKQVFSNGSDSSATSPRFRIPTTGNTIMVQSGTVTASTNAAGGGTIGYPVAFANPVWPVATVANNATATNLMLIPTQATANSFGFQTPSIQNSAIRINYIAIGPV